MKGMPNMNDAIWIAIIAALTVATISRVAALRNVVYATV